MIKNIIFLLSVFFCFGFSQCTKYLPEETPSTPSQKEEPLKIAESDSTKNEPSQKQEPLKTGNEKTTHSKEAPPEKAAPPKKATTEKAKEKDYKPPHKRIREDVLHRIQTFELSSEIKKVLVLYAVSLEEVVQMSLDRDSSLKQTRKQFAYEKCYRRLCRAYEKEKGRSNYSDYCEKLSDEIYSLTYNTEDRIKANMKLHSFLRGQGIEMPPEACEE
jgi:hypothetical protein